METTQIVLFLSAGFGAGALLTIIFFILRERLGKVPDHRRTKQDLELNCLETKVSEPKRMKVKGSPMVSGPASKTAEGSGPFLLSVPRMGEFKHISFTPDEFIDQRRSKQVPEPDGTEVMVSEPENMILPGSPMVSEPDSMIEVSGPFSPSSPKLGELQRISLAPSLFSPLWKEDESPESVEQETPIGQAIPYPSPVGQASPYPSKGTSSEPETDKTQNTSINYDISKTNPQMQKNDLAAPQSVRGQSIVTASKQSIRDLHQIEQSRDIGAGRVNIQQPTSSASVNIRGHKRRASEVYFSAIKRSQERHLAEGSKSIQSGILGRRNTSSTSVVSRITTIESVSEDIETPHLMRL
jgi:hypothetical protein